LIVYKDPNEISPQNNTAVTVGSFDGVHLGHHQIFSHLRDGAIKHELKSTIVTFDPHPQKILNTRNSDLKILTDLDEKLELFEKIGIQQVVILPFTKEFSRISYLDFVRSFLVEKLKVRHMVIGHDHHFGRDREGGFNKLIDLGNKYGFLVTEIPAYTINGQTLSSTLIRDEIESGNVEKAANYLGRLYGISAKVVRGDGRGKQIGYPTANLKVINSDKVIPKRGVYAVKVIFQDKKYRGMMNIGYRPTFNYDSLTLEVHLFNFNAEIYGQRLNILFKMFIRKENKFPSVKELILQLDKDKEICEKL
jgi:riboflavin kinase/FMN adenylyltransferase